MNLHETCENDDRGREGNSGASMYTNKNKTLISRYQGLSKSAERSSDLSRMAQWVCCPDLPTERKHTASKSGFGTKLD